MGKITTMLILAIILVPVLLPAVFAKEIFSGSISNKETLVVEQYTISADYISSSKKLLLKVNDFGRILELEECGISDKLTICFTSDNNPSFGIKVTTKEPDVAITRAFSKTNPNLGERIDIETTIENIGDDSASNIVFEDSFPTEFIILASSMERQGNTIVWKGFLNPGAKTALTYSLEPKTYIDYESKARVSYSFEGQLKEKESSAFIRVKKPYSFSDALSSVSVRKGQKIVYNMSLKNEDANKELKVLDLSISIPRGLEITLWSSGMQKEDNILHYQGALGLSEQKEFFVHLEASREGDFLITTKGKVESNRIQLNLSSEKKVSVVLTDIIPVIEINQTKLKSNAPFTIKISLKNILQEDTTASAAIESQLFKKETVTDVAVKAGSSLMLLTRRLNAPSVEEKKAFTINLTGAYGVPGSSQVISFHKEEQIIVEPLEKLLGIERKTADEAQRGKSIEVNISLVNYKNEEIKKINVLEFVPKELRKYIKGSLDAAADLAPFENKNVYSYTIEVPSDYKDDSFRIKTVLSTKKGDQLYTMEQEKEIMVTGEIKEKPVEEAKVELTGNETNATAAEQGKTVAETKEGFFQKIISFFKKLFNRDSRS